MQDPIVDSEMQDEYFFGISARPSAIIEYRHNDLDNVIASKVYMVSYNNDPYIGEF